MANDKVDAPLPLRPWRSTRRLPTHTPRVVHRLVRLFSALEFGLGALTLYQHTPDFAAVQRAVESSCQLSFKPAHLQQILHLLPGAYLLEWKNNTRTARDQANEDGGNAIVARRQRRTQQPPLLTLRKQQLPAPDSACKSLEARITLFISKVNVYLEKYVDAIKKEFPDMTEEELSSALQLVEIEKAPLPQMPTEIMNEDICATMIRRKGSRELIHGTSGTKANDKQTEALAKPIPQDLKSLPEWLIHKVRKQEACRKDIEDSSAKALKRRLWSTMPQLSDQLQSLVMVTGKSVFPKAYILRRLALRAPIKGRIEEQLYLLESMVPEWLTVVLDDGNEYIKISTNCKYNAIKASLRRAISVQF